MFFETGGKQTEILHKYQVEDNIGTHEQGQILPFQLQRHSRARGEEALGGSRLCSLSERWLFSASQIQFMLQDPLWVGLYLMQHSTMTSLTSWELPDFLCHMKNHCALPKKMLKRETSGGLLQEMMTVVI